MQGIYLIVFCVRNGIGPPVYIAANYITVCAQCADEGDADHPAGSLQEPAGRQSGGYSHL